MKSLCIATALTLVSLSTSAFAQNPGCKICAAKSTVSACVKCVRVEYAGQYTEAQMQSWCSTNQPICMSRNKK